ncbi:hypothetical protein RUND412_002087 [Rhizina undulata]
MISSPRKQPSNSPRGNKIPAKSLLPVPPTPHPATSHSARTSRYYYRRNLRATYTPANIAACIACHTPDAPKLCSGCRSVNYCSIDCQKPDWRKHKPVCKEISEQLYASAKLSAALSKSFTMKHADPKFRIAPVSYTKDTLAPPLGKLRALDQYQLDWTDAESGKKGSEIFEWGGTEWDQHLLNPNRPTSCSQAKCMDILDDVYGEAAGGILKLANYNVRDFYGLVLNYVTYGTSLSWGPCHE